MITVNRRYHFCASHRLHVAAWSEDNNNALFGKCNNPFGHGHNYEIEVSVDGPIDAVTGQAVDLGKLDRLVTDQVVARLDHRYLNEEISEFQKVVPTTENLGSEIWARLAGTWTSAFPSGEPRLRRIRILETDRNIIELSAG